MMGNLRAGELRLLAGEVSLNINCLYALKKLSRLHIKKNIYDGRQT